MGALWLTEGIAEFYQNPEILEDRVRLGKADPSFQAVIERYPRLSLSTLFAVDAHSPYYHGNDKGSIKSSFQDLGPTEYLGPSSRSASGNTR